jgi:D,D-heptose 1,7-bisphosphate phosphatase
MMNNKAIFLDRDGTINSDKGYTYKIEDLQFIKGVIEGLKKLQNKGYKLIIASNQSGIARGYYTEEDYFVFRSELHRKLKEQGILIDAEYFCPHHPEKGTGKYRVDCNYRKPKIGMLEQAAKDFNLNLRECWVIGDKFADIETGKNAECRTIYVLTGEEKNPIEYADFVAKDMVEAANYILFKDKNK